LSGLADWRTADRQATGIAKFQKRDLSIHEAISEVYGRADRPNWPRYRAERHPTNALSKIFFGSSSFRSRLEDNLQRQLNLAGCG